MRRPGAAAPRPHPAGGWYCEVGTSKPPACGERATWIMDGYSAARPFPGTVLCEIHHAQAVIILRGSPRVRYVPLVTIDRA